MSYVVVILSFLYTGFLLLGALIFMYLEWDVVESVNFVEANEWILIKEIIISEAKAPNETRLKTLLGWLETKCPQLPTDFNFQISNNDTEPEILIADISRKCSEILEQVTNITYIYPWDFLDALYFSMTVSTTIGYGHILPSTTEGRFACIIYAIVGIPFTMILLTRSSNFFGEVFYRFFTSKLDKEKQMSKVFIALGTVFYIIVGFVFFIFLPAIIFMYIEDWTYFEGVYYAFITLTTIGFGDFVTGKTMESAVGLYIYQIFVIIWIMSGLGYWVMVANFITRAVQSKKLTLIAKKATHMMKMMNPSGTSHIDPEYLLNNSKASMAFMMQLTNAFAMQATASSQEIDDSNSMRCSQLHPRLSSVFINPEVKNTQSSVTELNEKLGLQNNQNYNTLESAVESDKEEDPKNIIESQRIRRLSSNHQNTQENINVVGSTNKDIENQAHKNKRYATPSNSPSIEFSDSLHSSNLFPDSESSYLPDDCTDTSRDDMSVSQPESLLHLKSQAKSTSTHF